MEIALTADKPSVPFAVTKTVPVYIRLILVRVVTDHGWRRDLLLRCVKFRCRLSYFSAPIGRPSPIYDRSIKVSPTSGRRLQRKE